MKKNSKRTAWILGLVGATALSISALASGINGTVSFEPPMSINGVATGPASLIINGDAAKSMYLAMTARPENADSTNPPEHNRDGSGIVCHKIDSNGSSTYYCRIDFSDMSNGVVDGFPQPSQN